jgi:hypothetical protein
MGRSILKNTSWIITGIYSVRNISNVAFFVAQKKFVNIFLIHILLFQFVKEYVETF